MLDTKSWRLKTPGRKLHRTQPTQKELIPGREYWNNIGLGNKIIDTEKIYIYNNIINT